MHGWTTNRHERYVSTMLTESDLSIALLVRPFQASGRCNWRCKTTSTVARCAFRLDVSRKSAHAQRHRKDGYGTQREVRPAPNSQRKPKYRKAQKQVCATSRMQPSFAARCESAHQQPPT